jgi:hypothetical protein
MRSSTPRLVSLRTRTHGRTGCGRVDGVIGRVDDVLVAFPRVYPLAADGRSGAGRRGRRAGAARAHDSGLRLAAHAGLRGTVRALHRPHERHAMQRAAAGGERHHGCGLPRRRLRNQRAGLPVLPRRCSVRRAVLLGGEREGLRAPAEGRHRHRMPARRMCRPPRCRASMTRPGASWTSRTVSAAPCTTAGAVLRRQDRCRVLNSASSPCRLRDHGQVRPARQPGRGLPAPECVILPQALLAAGG